MKAFFVSILLVAQTAVAQTDVFFSFKEWQELRIREAQAILVKTQIDRAESISKDTNSVSANDVQQAKINVEIAKELTAHDYFVLYVVPGTKGNKNALLMAIQSLSKPEIADILSAYQTSIEEKKRAVTGPEKAPAGEFVFQEQADYLSNLFEFSKKPKN